MTLVDTSVWIDVFRKREPLDLEALVDLDEVVTCLPVLQEVLQGFRDERAFRLAREAMLALPIVDSPLPSHRFEAAVDLYRRCRSHGIMVRSSVDCLIAASAVEHDLEVLHRNRDYALIARATQLRERAV
jgi:predicted nucleic acid-binding protein